MADALPPAARYFIAVASRDHVLQGVKGKFAQFCHGKEGPAKRPRRGDWVVYYASKERFGEPAPCQRFVAVGQVADDAPTQVEQFGGFCPFRRAMAYKKCAEVPIQPLLLDLTFIKNKQRWGMAFRFGFLEILADDFTRIAKPMLNP